jgi:glutathione S-transferase
MEKVNGGLVEMEQRAHGYAGRLDIGTIAVACTLGYLDLRFAALAWRGRFPQLAAAMESLLQRPSLVSTRPPAA